MINPFRHPPPYEQIIQNCFNDFHQKFLYNLSDYTLEINPDLLHLHTESQ